MERIEKGLIKETKCVNRKWQAAKKAEVELEMIKEEEVGAMFDSSIITDMEWPREPEHVSELINSIRVRERA